MSPRARATRSRAIRRRLHHLLEQALGQGDAPISPRKPLPDYIVEKRFAEPVATDGVICGDIVQAGRDAGRGDGQQGKGARRLEASFFRTDGAVRTIAVDTGQPVTRSEVIDRLFRERLDALSDPLDPGFGFDLIRLSASRTEIVVQQQRDLDANVHDNDELAALIDRIAARIGGRRVVVHLPQDTHIPERAVLAAPAQHHLAAARMRPGRRAPRASRRCGRCGCSSGRSRSRCRSRGARRAAAQFTWRRATHAVVPCRRPRAHRHGMVALAERRALTRDYFRVEDEAGLRFWIYRDGLYDRESRDAESRSANWFVHGLFA
jgi:protein ImuB